MTNLVGQSVKRVEDKRFITGKGRYVDDLVLPNMTYAAVVRSDVAHGNIRGIDTGEASRAPGRGGRAHRRRHGGRRHRRPALRLGRWTSRTATP